MYQLTKNKERKKSNDKTQILKSFCYEELG